MNSSMDGFISVDVGDATIDRVGTAPDLPRENTTVLPLESLETDDTGDVDWDDGLAVEKYTKNAKKK